jgi:hypothetical protein
MHTHVTYGEMESHDVWLPQTIAGQPSAYDSRAGHFANPRWLGSVPTTAEAPLARRRLAAAVARAAARRAGPKRIPRCVILRRCAPQSILWLAAPWRCTGLGHELE